jgi:putative spermidine/putrescine transport system ATP-binding protein
LIKHPKVLLLDEPLGALDKKLREQMQIELRALQREVGVTFVFVTHDQEEALSLSDRVVVMNHAAIEQVGAPFEIYNFPRTHFVASFVGTLNTLTAEVEDAAAGAVRVEGRIIVTAQPIAQARQGQRVTLALRPELLMLDSSDPSLNRLDGVVETISFLGAIVRLQIRMGEASLLLDEFNNPHLSLPALGATVTVCFGREACLVLAERA